MSFETALRLTEILAALAILQASAEHLSARDDRPLFALKALAATLLLSGYQSESVLVALCALSLWQLHRFDGPYNGGSDRMGMLVLWCLTAAHLLPGGVLPQMALGYLAVQLVLSYGVSGQVKLANPDWRDGTALRDVFAFSAYPVAENLRGFSARPRLMQGASWAVILFELLFPIALISQASLGVALALGAVFHLANAAFFGLNRFVWVWISAFPALIWLQDQLL